MIYGTILVKWSYLCWNAGLFLFTFNVWDDLSRQLITEKHSSVIPRSWLFKPASLSNKNISTYPRQDVRGQFCGKTLSPLVILSMGKTMVGKAISESVSRLENFVKMATDMLRDEPSQREEHLQQGQTESRVMTERTRRFVDGRISGPDQRIEQTTPGSIYL